MDINNINSVYFIGIGGIGMSALARYFKNIGKEVAGYDKTPTQLTDELIQSGISIHFKDDVQLISDIYKDPKTTLVVVTPAIPKDHSEWNYFLNNNFEIHKRAAVLGIITKDTYCFAVAGTHGKTTTSSILGHILYQSGLDVTAFLGGIVENYQSNLIGDGKTITVVEADEFDRSFLQLYPNMACVTSTEADHLDIYGTAQEMLVSFKEFADKVKDKTKFFKTPQVNLSGLTVGINEKADFNATNIKIQDGWYVFDIQTPSELVLDIRFALPGHHNISNALLAFAMAYTYGVSVENIKTALESFQGVRRRFSYKIRTSEVIYIDDYAHHPTEIDAVYQAVSELYGNKNVLVVFQPHLYSRTRDFLDDFARSLSQFKNVALMDIYPARELPIEGITSQLILDKITAQNKCLVGKDNLVDFILKSDAEVIVTIGAGDIGEEVSAIKQAIEEKIAINNSKK